MANFLGFDFSTQKLKAVVVDENLKLLHESNVDYDTQLPEFRTQGGFVKGKNGVVTVPVTLWIKALDLVLDQLKLDGVDFSNVKALSGAAQQHGSVYWQKNARSTLKNLDSSEFLHQQLQSCFSLKQSPIWMDSSTSEYCKYMELVVGGPEKMCEITGSKAYERFTGPQIAKLVDQRRIVYDNTERISLISSFACSLFLGDYASIDYAEASGMNLMDIKSKKWHNSCIEATKAPDLEEKLGKPVPPPPYSDCGRICKYFVERFGFNPNCRIVTFTGDNPATLAGMHLSEHDFAVSLGTSDTLIVPLKEPKTFVNGHLMCSPTNPNAYMSLLCFKNGSLTRERIRDTYANGSWDNFNTLLESTPRGNFGNIALYIDNDEILPYLKKGEYRWNAKGEKVTKYASPEIEIRALIEGQFLTRRCYLEDLRLIKNHGSRIIATGGASQNKSILQVLSDVFNIPVYVQKSENSTALGSAYLAKIGVQNGLSTEAVPERLPGSKLVCTPHKDAAQIYDQMMTKYKTLLSGLLDF